MSSTELHDVLEAHLAGRAADVPDHLRSDFEQAVAGYEALQYALGETITHGSNQPMDRPPPALPQDYEIVRELGRGGMGVVYLVQQKSLRRLVAVKVLRPGEAAFGKLLQRFLEEARHLARLRHPNIVSIHEVGHAGEEPYFTMDYVEGEPLSSLLLRERISPTRAIAIWKQAAEAVQHAHAQGIIHRDLKPGNVLVDAQGNAYVTDFGLARDMTQSSQLTRSGEVMGTPAYMAPEQALGQLDRIGEATDVHALGVLLYEMLTGNAPYGKDAPANVLVRLLKEEPMPPRRLDKRISRELETICLKAMAKEPSRRYATVRAFLEDVRRFDSGEPVQARRPGIVDRSVRVARRHWKLTAAVTLTAIAVLSVTAFVAGPGRDDLLIAGDERHAGGNHRGAIDVYRRCLQRTWGFDRVSVLERIIRCSQEASDRETVVAAGLELLQWDPDAWLDEDEYRIAQAVLERHVSLPAASALPIGITSGFVPRMSTAELAAHRFNLFLNHPFGTPDERSEAAAKLMTLRQTLGKEPWETITELWPAWKPPVGTPEELLKSADDAEVSIQHRITAAFAAGLALEHAGDAPSALAAYRQAYEILVGSYPVYAGTNSGIESLRPRSLHWEAHEPRLLRIIAQHIRRLDPDGPALLRGGIRFRIAGLDLSPDVGLKLKLSLWRPDVLPLGRGTEIIRGEEIPAAIGEAPVQLDQTAWVGVADGRYRLVVDTGSRSSRGAGHAARQYNMLEFDFSSLPEEVDIRGETVDLPPIRATLVEVIEGQQPDEHAAIDRQTAVLRWDPFPLAASYRVTLWRTEVRGGGRYFKESHTVTTKGPALPLADIPEDIAVTLGLTRSGSSGAWSVEAYDASGRWIARSRAQRSFTVAGRNPTE